MSTNIEETSSSVMPGNEEKEQDYSDFDYNVSFNRRRKKKRKKRRREHRNTSEQDRAESGVIADVPSSATSNYNKFPRYFIIGFAKTGTKALYELLKMHPHLSGPAKEMRYFSKPNPNSLESYLEQFPDPPAQGHTIEKSPDYILSSSAPLKLKQAAEQVGLNETDLKFIIMLRNPVARTVSDYLEMQIWNLNNNHERLPPFSKLVSTAFNQTDYNLHIINGSCYAYHIERWLQYFNSSNICYVNGDNFIIDPYKESKILEHCLGLEPYFMHSHFVFNKKKGFYCFKSPGIKCLSPGKGRKHPNISDEVVDQLKEYFRPWNEKLYNIVERHFNWENSMKY